ncbi:MAG: CoA pyrophosphatase [Bacteroidota bacterium]
MNTFIDDLQAALQQPLPGQVAQFEMAHGVRKNTIPPPPDAREAGVMALLFPKARQWHLTLIQRTSTNPNDRHSGQVSFPGGKREESDDSLQITALREAEEEVGVKADDITVLGSLTELYIPVSNFKVQPYVGFLAYQPTFDPQPSEVQMVIEAPFTAFQDRANHKLRDLQIQTNLVLRNVPYFAIDEHMVWGATAMMISELLHIAPKLD